MSIFVKHGIAYSFIGTDYIFLTAGKTRISPAQPDMLVLTPILELVSYLVYTLC